MIEFSWQKDNYLRLGDLLLKSHEKAFGQPLIKFKQEGSSSLIQNKKLFNLEMPVIAHNDDDDPCICYANDAALRLWCRSWREMIGMPSRLTAPYEEYEKRKALLAEAIRIDAIKNSQGIRINSKKQKFVISNVRVWTLWNEKDFAFGQAATFTSWWKI